MIQVPNDNSIFNKSHQMKKLKGPFHWPSCRAGRARHGNIVKSLRFGPARGCFPGEIRHVSGKRNGIIQVRGRQTRQGPGHKPKLIKIHARHGRQRSGHPPCRFRFVPVSMSAPLRCRHGMIPVYPVVRTCRSLAVSGPE